MKVKIFSIFVFILFLVSCAAAPKLAEKQSSEYLSTTGAGFVIEGNTVKYAMSYLTEKKLDAPIYVEVEFENPSENGVITTGKVVTPEDIEVFFESPAMNAIKNNKAYLTKAKIYEDETKAKLLSEHLQEVSFSTPSSVLQQLGIKEL